jgi:predicted RNA-binding Zn-ribbon protein involved in translation (DUF1610 family)
MPNIEKCPTCNVELEIEDSAYDQVFECPKCKTDVIIPKRRMVPRVVAPRPVIASRPETVSQGNIIAGYALAVIVPFIGFFVGIYLLAKKEPGHGVACMAISILAGFIWFSVLMSG